MPDTHGYLHPLIEKHFRDVDEIWHAGDIGSMAVAEALEAFKPLRAVHGNVDDRTLRSHYPENQRFICEDMDTWITHIGGYPGHYAAAVRPALLEKPPGLFICGHSHILKIMPDRQLGLLHINPGACGRQGWHKTKTIVRFVLQQGRVEALEVIELPDIQRA